MTAPGLLPSLPVAPVADLLVPLHAGSHGGIVPSPKWLALLAVVAAGLGYAWYAELLGGFQLLGLGVLTAFVGNGLDQYWHSVHPGGELGVVPPAHFVALLGALVAFGGCVRAFRRRDGLHAGLAALGGLSAAVMLLGRTWDNVLHYQGFEPAAQAPPHLLGAVGMLGLLGTTGLVGVVLAVPRLRSALGSESGAAGG